MLALGCKGNFTKWRALTLLKLSNAFDQQLLFPNAFKGLVIFQTFHNHVCFFICFVPLANGWFLVTLHHWNYLSEPDGAPQRVRGQNISSTSISVSWDEVQAELKNGIITGYNITYQSQTENDNGFVEAGPNDRQANLTGLKEFVKYNISVVAFTVKGDGPPSVTVVSTDQDSK